VRVGDATFFRQILAGLESARERSSRALLEMADGKKVRRASDDPAGAHIALSLRARLTRLEGFDRAARTGRTDLATLDRVLGEAIQLVSTARTEAQAGASFPFDEANEAHAQKIEQLREQLLALANTSQSGRYLFGGTETLTLPFASDGSYAGNDDEAQVSISENQQVGATLSGRRVFIGGVDLFTLFDDVAQALRDNRTDDVAAELSSLKAGLDHLIEVRADVGLRIQQIDAALERRPDEAEGLIRRIAEIENVELERVLVEFQSASTSSEALAAAASRVLGRSLFDYLG
jgi:flagellar hook-associated protein 3 FlgL